jgi:hypothetical protein
MASGGYATLVYHPLVPLAPAPPYRALSLENMLGPEFSVLPERTPQMKSLCPNSCEICNNILSTKRQEWHLSWLRELNDWKSAHVHTDLDGQVNMIPSDSEDAVLNIRSKLANLQVKMVCCPMPIFS